MLHMVKQLNFSTSGTRFDEIHTNTNKNIIGQSEQFHEQIVNLNLFQFNNDICKSQTFASILHHKVMIARRTKNVEGIHLGEFFTSAFRQCHTSQCKLFVKDS